MSGLEPVLAKASVVATSLAEVVRS